MRVVGGLSTLVGVCGRFGVEKSRNEEEEIYSRRREQVVWGGEKQE